MSRAGARTIPACVMLALSPVLALLALAAPPAEALPGFSPTDEGPSYADSADGRKSASPTIQAYRLDNQEIRLDGHLDDAAWQAAPAGRGFTVWEPDRGVAPAEQTVFKVAYDEGAVYFGIACLKSDTFLPPVAQLGCTVIHKELTSV